jgi:hypothetical protein
MLTLRFSAVTIMVSTVVELWLEESDFGAGSVAPAESAALAVDVHAMDDRAKKDAPTNSDVMLAANFIIPPISRYRASSAL